MPDEKELTDAEKGNFTAQPEGETAVGYVANFDGDEIDGKRYALGDEIDDGIDAGTIAFLVGNGRITPFTKGSGKTPSGSDETPIPAGTGGDKEHAEDDGGPTLTDEQQAEADTLANGTNKADLLAMAEAEGVEGVTEDNNKAEIAAKIVAARNE